MARIPKDVDRSSLKALYRVAAEHLDKEVPGWHNHVDTSTIVMTDVRYCILGQVFRDFYNTPPTIHKDTDKAPFGCMSDANEWITLINERKLVGLKSTPEYPFINNPILTSFEYIKYGSWFTDGVDDVWVVVEQTIK